MSVERLVGRTREAGLKFSQITRPIPYLAASSRSFEWMDAEKDVMMIAPTSSSGTCRLPFALLQVSWLSLQESEHSGASMLPMW